MRWDLPAKVNWTLRVLGRRPDGFHELRSWFVAVDLCDRLSAAPCAAGPSRLEVAGGPPAPTGAENLVLKAEAAWRAAGGRAPALEWRLEKRIPAAAGLGGASSDAAGALCALEHFAARPLGLRDCGAVAAAVGSDVPFFFSGCGAELRGGRGELLLARAPAPQAWLVLAAAPLEVPTPAVYARLGARPWEPAGRAGPEALPAQPGANDLEAAAYALHPELAAWATELRRHADFRMSGSGGVHFAACASQAAARQLAASIGAGAGPVFVAAVRDGAVIREAAPCR